MIKYKSLSYQFDDILKYSCINCNKCPWMTYQHENNVSYRCDNCDISIGVWHKREIFCFIRKATAVIRFSYNSTIDICDNRWFNSLKSIKCSSNQEIINNLKNISNLFTLYKRLIILK